MRQNGRASQQQLMFHAASPTSMGHAISQEMMACPGRIMPTQKGKRRPATRGQGGVWAGTGNEQSSGTP